MNDYKVLHAHKWSVSQSGAQKTSCMLTAMGIMSCIIAGQANGIMPSMDPGQHHLHREQRTPPQHLNRATLVYLTLPLMDDVTAVTVRLACLPLGLASHFWHASVPRHSLYHCYPSSAGIEESKDASALGAQRSKSSRRTQWLCTYRSQAAMV